MIDPSYWFMLPLGLVVATTAMSAGISASNFWIPIYLMLLGLPAPVAFWLSLATMMFGYGSGLIRNSLADQVHWPLVGRCMLVCGPAAALGGYVSPRVAQQPLLLLFGVFVLLYGAYLMADRRGVPAADSRRRGVPWIALPAALLHGLIATGLGKLLLPAMLGRRDMDHHARAVGTVVTITFLSSLCALIFRMNGAMMADLENARAQLTAILIWVAPGVILGGQLGPIVARRLPKRFIKRYVGGLLLLVGGLILFRALA